MLEINKYKNKKVAIYGMGKSGFSVAKKLNKLGASVYCWDDSQKIRNQIKKYNQLTVLHYQAKIYQN